jgi:hypothetical protein
VDRQHRVSEQDRGRPGDPPFNAALFSQGVSAGFEAAFGLKSLVDLTLLVGFFHTICVLLSASWRFPAPARAPQPTTSAT